MRMSNRPSSARGGFTLIELLLVIAIIVMVMGLVLPWFMGAKAGADIDAAKSQIGIFKSSLDMYQLHMNSYPETEHGLVALVEEPTEADVADRWRGPYFDKAIPQDPWGNDYQYEYPPSHNTLDFPDIWSYGPDGEDGTEDDIVNWEDESTAADLAAN